MVHQKKVDGGTFFFDAAQVRDLTGATHAGLGKASGSLKTTEPHVFHTLTWFRGRPCPVQALTVVVWGPRSVRKWYTKKVDGGTFFPMQHKFVT